MKTKDELLEDAHALHSSVAFLFGNVMDRMDEEERIRLGGLMGRMNTWLDNYEEVKKHGDS